MDLVNKVDSYGSQIVQKVEKEGHLHQDAAETAEAAEGSYTRELESVIENHKHVAGRYFIQVFCKTEKFYQRTRRFTFVARRTLPMPDWGQECYEVDNSTGRLRVLYTLPMMSDSLSVLTHPHGYEPFLAKCARLMATHELYQHCVRLVKDHDKPQSLVLTA